MLFGTTLTVLLLFVVTVVLQIRGAFGVRYAALFGMIAVLSLGAGWLAFEWAHRRQSSPPEDQTASVPITSQTCRRCHEAHYSSWQRTYHRTMTQEARPENVQGPFDGTPHHHLGVTARMLREGDKFFMECELPDLTKRKSGEPASSDSAGARVKYTVDRLIGSHWFQQLLHLGADGRYVRLPMIYHIVEGRWVHANGVFLDPERENFFGRLSLWNKGCVYCHNTRPAANPQPIPGQLEGFRTTVGELGISCEACHGAGERHVRAHQNPAKRLAQLYSQEPDPTIVNPAKLTAARSVDVCAHCHSGTAARLKEWNPATLADPYLAGRDLKRFWFVPFSQEDFKLFNQDAEACCGFPGPNPPAPLDGRFWGDGTPHSTATEYQGMAMSACYERGQGKMTCLTCHSMHKSDKNHMVKEGMRTNEACYSCHENYRARLAEHTHHAADSHGSLCYNCHMPHQVYGLLSGHRSHRISIPRVRDSLGTGKPHACNLCHLDKSMGWTQEQLVKWYGTRPEPLSNDDHKYASSVLSLTQGDARTRAVVAEAFSWPPALEASGRDWAAPLLLGILERERYQAVRYSTYKALRTLLGPAAKGYEYQAPPAERAAQSRDLRAKLGNAKSDRRVLLTDDVFERLLKTRVDPNVTINE